MLVALVWLWRNWKPASSVVQAGSLAHSRMKVIFWLLVTIDVIAVGVFALLALAAAGPSKTNPVLALVYPIGAALILFAAIRVFLGAQGQGARIGATLVAALPMLILAAQGSATLWELRGFRDADGNIREFRSEALNAIEAAIERNDVAAVKAALPGADVNAPGISGVTVLVLALRQLEKTPDQLEVVKALLAAGADPNIGPSELPLQVAIGVSHKAGAEPVRLLLEAGANPNARSEFGNVVYFIAGAAGADVGTMQMLLARGADVQLKDSQGESAVLLPTRTRNWPVLLLLLERGAPWRDQKGPGGVPWRGYVEQDAAGSTEPGAAEVLAWLRAQGSTEAR